MADFPNGFSLVEGPHQIRHSTVSSAATFVARVPVVLEDASRTLVEATSASSQIYGIAQADAANSFTRDRLIPVLVATTDQVWATKVQTGVTALEDGEAFDIEKSGDFFRLDSDSVSSALLRVTSLAGANTIRSADSIVFVQFLGNAIGPFGSNASAVL